MLCPNERQLQDQFRYCASGLSWAGYTRVQCLGGPTLQSDLEGATSFVVFVRRTQFLASFVASYNDFNSYLHFEYLASNLMRI